MKGGEEASVGILLAKAFTRIRKEREEMRRLKVKGREERKFEDHRIYKLRKGAESEVNTH